MENLTKKAAGKTMIFITHLEKIAQYCERTCPVQRLA
jgi:ABC-type lipoprotein export system ATPase subunit